MEMSAKATWRGPRPRSWAKNGLLLVGVIFAGSQAAGSLGPALYGILLFSLAASLGYAVNDLADAKADLENPLHRGRRYPISTALPFLAGLPLALALGLRQGLVSPAMAMLVGGYLLLSLLYSWALKRVPLVEILVLTMFFLARVLAGTVGVGIEPSVWLVVATFLMALMLATGKRLAELRAAGGKAAHRIALAHYTEGFLLGISRLAAGLALLVYCLYAAERPDRGLAFLLPTLPFVAYGIMRYLWIIETRRPAATPEEILLTDRPSLANLGLWLAVTALVLR